MRHRALALVFAVIASATFVMSVSQAPSAQAQCAPDSLHDDWRNIDPNTSSITRAVVDVGCGDVVTCDEDGNCTTSGGITTRVWGSCSPTDCDWGDRSAQRMHDGWIRGTYDFGFKTSDVWMKTYEYWDRTYLRVWVYNDFTDRDGRADYTTDEWMLPA